MSDKASSYAHQDWNTVYLNKDKQKTASTCSGVSATLKHQRSITTMSSVANKPAWKIEQQVDSETGKAIDLISKEDATSIRDMRVQAKLTQVDLANRLNMKHKDIQDIENQKAVSNKAVISRIKRYLTQVIDLATAPSLSK